MSKTRTSDFLDLEIGEPGNWSDVFQKRPAFVENLLRFGRTAGVALALVASPSTTGLDLWVLDKRRTSAVFGLYPSRVYRNISVAEARKIALEILNQAELERLAVAEEESRRGIDWSTA